MGAILEYKCPCCCGPLQFDTDSQKMKCPYCDNEFDAETLKANDDILKEEKPDMMDWSSQPGNEWMQGELDGQKVYLCKSCGGQIICDDTTGATDCPYCGSPVVLVGQFAGDKRPDLIIPFKLDKEAAKAGFKQHLQKKRLLPKQFRKDSYIDEIKGVYVPFWLFDETVTGDARFAARRVRVRREGDYEVTSIDHFAVHRSGTASFTRIPADGSKKMPDDYMDSLEPFDYNELKAFSTAYLPGYLADRYDVSAKECAARADRRCVASTAELLERDVVGYSSINLVEMQSKVQHGNVHYALLPVWLLNTKWNGKDYLYAMNGQTGKFVGELPVSGKRVWTATLLLTALLTGLFYFTGIARWLLELFL